MIERPRHFTGPATDGPKDHQVLIHDAPRFEVAKLTALADEAVDPSAPVDRVATVVKGHYVFHEKSVDVLAARGWWEWKGWGDGSK